MAAGLPTDRLPGRLGGGGSWFLQAVRTPPAVDLFPGSPECPDRAPSPVWRLGLAGLLAPQQAAGRSPCLAPRSRRTPRPPAGGRAPPPVWCLGFAGLPILRRSFPSVS
jgi:hypothetical protein